MYDCIVIGGGPAGLRAAHRARQLGARVALVERQRLGGTAVNDGVAPTRTLARAARYLRDARQQFAEYGIRAASVQVDFPALMAKTRQVVDAIHRHHDFEGALRSAGVDVFVGAGEARFNGPNQVILTDGRRLEAGKFILCVGGRARQVDFPGVEFTLNHHDLWTLERLPKSLVVVGGAATGCQVASIAAQFGVQITLLEMAPRLVAVEDEQTSAMVRRIYEARGMDVVTGIGGIQRIERSSGGLRLFYKAGAAVRDVEAEAVFIAAGWPGNADLLNLAAVGVEVERSYIKVNEYLQSTAEHVYAAGDVNGRMMLTQCARIEADIAVENALQGNHRVYEPLLISHGSFTDPEYAGVGLTEAQAREKHDCVVAVVPFEQLDRAIIDSHTDGYFKLIADRKSHRILGGHAAGEQATDIIQAVAASMQANETVDELSHLELAYPTYTSVVSMAASRITHVLGIETQTPAEHHAAASAGAKQENRYADYAL